MFFFKARNPDRDKTSDKARLDALVRQVDEVRSGVMRERRGLERRYADWLGEASHLVDTGYDGDRDEAAERDLSRVESNAQYASRRMAELDRHMSALDGLTDRIKVMFETPEALKKLRKP